MDKIAEIVAILQLVCIITAGILLGIEFGWKIGLAAAASLYVLMPPNEE